MESLFRGTATSTLTLAPPSAHQAQGRGCEPADAGPPTSYSSASTGPFFQPKSPERTSRGRSAKLVVAGRAFYSRVTTRSRCVVNSLDSNSSGPVGPSARLPRACPKQLPQRARATGDAGSGSNRLQAMSFFCRAECNSCLRRALRNACAWACPTVTSGCPQHSK